MDAYHFTYGFSKLSPTYTRGETSGIRTDLYDSTAVVHNDINVENRQLLLGILISKQPVKDRFTANPPTRNVRTRADHLTEEMPGTD